MGPPVFTNLSFPDPDGQVKDPAILVHPIRSFLMLTQNLCSTVRIPRSVILEKPIYFGIVSSRTKVTEFIYFGGYTTIQVWILENSPGTLCKPSLYASTERLTPALPIPIGLDDRMLLKAMLPL
jgi:hypothetical protein